MNQIRTWLGVVVALLVLSCGPQQSESNTTTVELPAASATMAIDSSSDMAAGTPAAALGRGWVYRTEYGQDEQVYTATISEPATTGPDAPLNETRIAALTLRRESVVTSLLLDIDEGALHISDLNLGEIKVRYNDGTRIPYVVRPDPLKGKYGVEIIGGDDLVRHFKKGDKVHLEIPLKGEGVWQADFEAPALKWDH